jgi:membrane protease YdiL (CAAX protease family)
MHRGEQPFRDGEPVPGFVRRFLAVWALGAVGVLGLALQGPPAALLEQAPGLGSLPPPLLRALLLLNPLLMVTAAAAIGAAVAHRTGLAAHVAGTTLPDDAGLPRKLAAASLAGLVLGLALGTLDRLLEPALGEQWRAFAAAASAAPLLPGLLVGVLYGGLAEEVVLRWGLMSLVAWLLLRISRFRAGLAGARVDAHAGSRPGPVIAWTAIVLAAIAFAAGHLPALALAIDPTPAIVARTLALNALGGLLYGWLFWRRGLEAAMAAHAATHVGLGMLRSLA